MTTWDPQANDLFLKLLELPSGDERRAVLERECAGDAALRAEVESLLAAVERAGSFLESAAPALALTLDLPLAERPGTVIGPYKLLEQIGEGGMGVVFMAEQTEPVRRKVALKVIRPGLDGRQILARFDQERQALALMDHPNIARVLDAGTIPVRSAERGVRSEEDLSSTPHSALRIPHSGRPYFAMELVRGLPITDYCDQEHLTPRERLELFVPVCRAVQHAHQKGVIHRDLKPSNVLVTLLDGKPVAKVIDFGIAKAAGSPLTDATLFTGFAQMVGTPLYMSPEQAAISGQDVDTRSDVYSLGVLLYELLTGTTPFDRERFKTETFDEIRRIIREEEPPRPSTRVSTAGGDSVTLSARRRSDPAHLCRLLRGELDWVVMRALEKDRNRRYESASAFAADIERYLNDEPVQACPPSASYRLRKFARRNRRALATAAVLAAALVVAVGAAAGSVGWAARDRAARRATAANEAQLALHDAAALRQQRRWPEALEAIKRAESLLAAAGDTPLSERAGALRADLEFVLTVEEIGLGQAAVKDGKFADKEAEPQYAAAFGRYGLDVDALTPEEAAARVRDQAIHPEIVAALDDWTRVRRLAKPKETGWQHLVAVARLADTDSFANQVRAAWGRRDENELRRLAGEALTRPWPAAIARLFERALDRDRDDAAVVPLFREAQRRYPDDFWINHQLARRLQRLAERPGSRQAARQDQLDEAIGFLRAAVALRPGSAGVRLNLARAHYDRGSFEDATAAYQSAVDLKPDYVEAHTGLGNALAERGKWAEAAASHREAIRLRPDDYAAHNNLAIALYEQGNLDGAIATFREAVRLKPDFAARTNLGSLLAEKGAIDEAIVELREAVRLNPNSAEAHSNLGAALEKKGDLDGALAEHHEALRLKPDFADAHFNLGIVRARQGKLDEALAAHRAAVRLKPGWAEGHFKVGYVLKRQTKWEQAVAAYQEALRLDPKHAPALNNLAVILASCPDERHRDPARAVLLATKAVDLAPKQVIFRSTLGEALYRAGDWKAAAAAINEAIELRQGGDGHNWFILALAHWRLGDKEKAHDFFTHAVEWTQKNDPNDDDLRRLRAEATALITPN